MWQETCAVVANQKVAPGHFVLKCASARIGRAARPGQFAQLLCAEDSDPLLPRPFSFLSADKKSFSVLYQVVGKGTRLLSLMKKGQKARAVGPLGNGFSVRPPSTIHHPSSVVLIGGGVGIPPLYHLAETLIQKSGPDARSRIHVFLGARNKSLLLCEKEFGKLGVPLHLSTDDGSKGHRGFVTEFLESFLHYPPSTIHHPKIYTCGPTPMLKAVSALAQKFGVPCEVSVEEPMACGFGACLGCAIKIKEGTGYRYVMACTEGPVFEAAEVLWD